VRPVNEIKSMVTESTLVQSGGSIRNLDIGKRALTLGLKFNYFNKHKICDQSKTCPVRVAVRNVWQTSRIETCLLTWSQLPVAVGNIIPPLKINVQMWTTDTMSNLQRINADSELEP